MKKVLSVFIVIILSIGCSTNAFASTGEILTYEEILDDINENYDLELGYLPVDQDKMTLEKYKEVATKFAISQRELLDYIENRKISTESEYFNIERAAVQKTKTKPTWELGEYFTITATYTVEGKTMSLCRNAQLNMTNAAIFTNTYLTDISKPAYSMLDGSRTSTVLYKATVHFDSVLGFSNISLYTEFYYSD